MMINCETRQHRLMPKIHKPVPLDISMWSLQKSFIYPFPPKINPFKNIDLAKIILRTKVKLALVKVKLALVKVKLALVKVKLALVKLGGSNYINHGTKCNTQWCPLLIVQSCCYAMQYI